MLSLHLGILRLGAPVCVNWAAAAAHAAAGGFANSASTCPWVRALVAKIANDFVCQNCNP